MSKEAYERIMRFVKAHIARPDVDPDNLSHLDMMLWMQTEPPKQLQEYVL